MIIFLADVLTPSVIVVVEKRQINAPQLNKLMICFNNTDPQEIAKVIYNGIVEFALNEYEINYDDLEREQRRAILSRIRYNPTADNSAKLKYGFYGEVLLDLILRVFLQTSVVAARGYFYSPIENSEAKGFDAFHLLERDGNIDLWFGEAKFYLRYKDAITPVMEKLGTSLSDGYLNRNLIAIINERDHLSVHNTQLNSLLDSWFENPSINLAQEMQNRGIRLIYPILVDICSSESFCLNCSSLIRNR